MNLNKIFLLGNLVSDPETRTTPSGHQVTRFRMATNRVWVDPNTNQKQERAEFHNIVTWRRLAEIAAKYLAKGRLVFVEGRIEHRTYQGKDGQTKYFTEVVAENLQLGPRPAGSGESSAAFTQPREASSPSRNDTAKTPAAEEIPVIEEDAPSSSREEEKDIKPEDIPF